ncbi:hypothetical protein [Zoogloea sp.]|nr:hypothetical protein [Zoogloea sp.]MBN8285084.1 hypothetical protein [Zoogloea sp.]
MASTELFPAAAEADTGAETASLAGKAATPQTIAASGENDLDSVAVMSNN